MPVYEVTFFCEHTVQVEAESIADAVVEAEIAMIDETLDFTPFSVVLVSDGEAEEEVEDEE